MKIVPDTSVVVDGRVTERVKEIEEELEIIIPEAVVGELEKLANRGQETGFSGLEELESLRELADQDKLKLSFKGPRPTLEEIKLAPGGEIDDMIRRSAVKEEAILLTSDLVQAKIARAKGVAVEYLSSQEEKELDEAKIWNYFEDLTMSVHLREGVKPKAKIGMPGEVSMKTIGAEESTADMLISMAHEIIESAERSSDGFVEIDSDGATVVQLKDLRIVISHPPFSDGFEITAVRPIAKVTLADYRLSEELKDRLGERRRGVMIAGAPGAGKSTLAQAIAEYLLEKDFVVKTMEEPRDLQVSQEITQYTSLEGSIEDTADILLLVRPEYTIYDEVRKTPHFKVFADMRLAGVGMVGVTHANRGIDALQRLIGRVELGMVPQIVDTVVFLDEARIEDVYEVSYTVKVPAGMMEEDLARPVIEVKDFESGVVEYEIYSYGEQVVVMPIEESETYNPIWEIAEEEIEREVGSYSRHPVDASINSNDSARIYVHEDDIPSVLGRKGGNISRIEETLGLKLDVQPRNKKKKPHSVRKKVNVSQEKDKVIIDVGRNRAGEVVDIYSGGEHLFNATVGRDGSINIRRGTKAAEEIIEKVNMGKTIEAE